MVRDPYLVMFSTTPDRKCNIVKSVLLDVCQCFVEAFGTCIVEISQSFFVTFQMVIDPEALVILVQRSQFSKEREVFSWVLGVKL